MTNSGMSAFLFAVAGLALVVAASYWRKVGKDRERVDEVAKLRVHQVRDAATMTGVALTALGVALLWFAVFGLAAN